MGLFKFKDKKKNKEQNLSETRVRIIVKKLMGNRVPVTHLVFEAIQKRDSDFNLRLVNDDFNFKDDVTIVEHKIIEDLRYKLNFGNLNKEEKNNQVRSKILQQEKRLKEIKNGYLELKDNAGKIVKQKVNIIDEQNKLKQYKVLLDSIKHEDEGSYEEIAFDGLRQIMYKYEDGILYPYFHTNSTNTLYPSMTASRKTYKSEQDLIDREFLDENKHFLSGWKGIVSMAFILILVVSLVYGHIKLNQSWAQYDESKIKELVLSADTSAIKCAQYFATIGEETATFINASKQIKEQETKKAINIG